VFGAVIEAALAVVLAAVLEAGGEGVIELRLY